MVGTEEYLVAEDNGGVIRIEGVAVPFAPPSGTGVTGGSVVGVAAVKIHSIGATEAAGGGGRLLKAAVKVDGDEVPARAKRSLRKVVDEEHAVGAGDDPFVELGG